MSAKPKLTRAYIRPSRNHSEAAQRKILIAAGYAEDKFYVEGHVGIAELLKAIRGRSYRIGVTTLGRLGRTRELLRDVLVEIVKSGSTVHEVRSGIEITNQREVMIAVSVFDASRELIGDARGMSKAEAKRRGKLGGDARAKSIAERAAEERMPIGPAEEIWLNKKSRMTNKERLKLMPGWTSDLAYAVLGKRDVVSGRPRNDEK